MIRRWFHRQRLNIGLREMICQHEPVVSGHRWEDKYSKHKWDQQAGKYITTETAVTVDGFWDGIFFFNMENSLLVLADVTLASSSKQYHMLLETYFSVSFLSDVGWEGKGICTNRRLQYHSLYLLLSLGKMYDVQQDHLILQRKTHLTDQ